MNDFLNIKIANERYVQHQEFSKITIFNDYGGKVSIDSIDILPPDVKKILEDAITLKNNISKHFEYEYSKEEDKLILTKYIGSDLENIVIPEEINGKTIVLKGKIFYNNDNIKKIFIPDTIDSLDYSFCNDMKNLKYVYLSSNITTIPGFCFYGCVDLRDINLSKIKEINTSAFENCISIDKLQLENIEVIGSNAFSNCECLKTINLPNVTSIGHSAFQWCSCLKKVTLGNNLSKLNGYTFGYCESLEDIKLPNNLTHIGLSCFYECEALKTIIFPETLKTIDSCAFNYSGLSETINLPPSLESINDYAFGHTKIKQINVSKDTLCDKKAFHGSYNIDVKKYENNKIIKDEDLER